jgi:hypothetical protein
MAELLDVKRLIGQMAARHGLRMDESDPAFAIVALNRLVLEAAMEQFGEIVRDGIGDFEASIEKVERRGGKILAQDVKESCGQIRAALQKDIDAASIKAAHLVCLVDRAHKRPAMIRWITIALLSAAALSVAAFWLGFSIGSR